MSGSVQNFLSLFWCLPQIMGQGRSSGVYHNPINIFDTWATGQGVIRRPPDVHRSGSQRYSDAAGTVSYPRTGRAQHCLISVILQEQMFPSCTLYVNWSSANREKHGPGQSESHDEWWLLYSWLEMPNFMWIHFIEYIFQFPGPFCFSIM